MAANGNGTIYKVAITIVGLVIIGILSFMGTGIVKNDSVRAMEDQRIEDKIEISERDLNMLRSDVSDDISDVKESISDIKVGQKEIEMKQMHVMKAQDEMKVTLRFIAEKVQ